MAVPPCKLNNRFFYYNEYYIGVEWVNEYYVYYVCILQYEVITRTLVYVITDLLPTVDF